MADVQLSTLGSVIQVAYDGTAKQVISKSATFTLAAADFANSTVRDAIVLMTNASAATATIPANATLAIPIGTTLVFVTEGAGTLTVAGASGVTLTGNGGSVSAGSCDVQQQYSAASFTKYATDKWLAGGDIDVVA